MTKIVTRESLQAMLDSPDRSKVINVVGRALCALLERQTASEQLCNATDADNGVGFSGLDARSGTLTAKSFLKNKTLLDWQVDRWLKKQKNGFARLTRYHKQLNEIAEAKRNAA